MSLPDYRELVVVQRKAIQRFEEAMALGRWQAAHAWAGVASRCGMYMLAIAWLASVTRGRSLQPKVGAAAAPVTP